MAAVALAAVLALLIAWAGASCILCLLTSMFWLGVYFLMQWLDERSNKKLGLPEGTGTSWMRYNYVKDMGGRAGARAGSLV
jgi:hypothetical protein